MKCMLQAFSPTSLPVIQLTVQRDAFVARFEALAKVRETEAEAMLNEYRLAAEERTKRRFKLGDVCSQYGIAYLPYAQTKMSSSGRSQSRLLALTSLLTQDLVTHHRFIFLHGRAPMPNLQTQKEGHSS